MNRRRSLIASLLIPSVLYSGCIDVFSSYYGSSSKIRYIAIDIDDVFLSSSTVTEVKINSGDVLHLIELTEKIRSTFRCDFRFSLGYNCGYFDSSNSGDKALIEHAEEFAWFNHLPRHEHVKEFARTSLEIDNLLAVGRAFEQSHGIFTPHDERYLITPLNDGTWPPYDPLYESFNKAGILYTATNTIKSEYNYKGVRVLPRTLIEIGAGKHSIDDVSQSKISELARQLYNQIIINKLTLICAHQANFTDNRPAAKIIEELINLLLKENDYKFIFLPAPKAIENSAIVHGKDLS